MYRVTNQLFNALLLNRSRYPRLFLKKQKNKCFNMKEKDKKNLNSPQRHMKGAIGYMKINKQQQAFCF